MTVAQWAAYVLSAPSCALMQERVEEAIEAGVGLEALARECLS
jgi:hypothetical protein